VSQGSFRDVLPALLRIQADYAGDLSTPALAAAAGMSPAHFHRRFAAATGETVKQHTSRLRLERAAFRLVTERTGVSAVAFDCGFSAHEVFTRAFRRRYGVPPSRFRERGPTATPTERMSGVEQLTPTMRLSATRAALFRPLHVAFVRQVGPYEDVDPRLFDELAAWARRTGMAAGGYLGVGHDAPGITPAARLRFDACLHVAGPFAAEVRVGYQLLPEGWYAVTTHVGPLSTLPAAHREAFRRAQSLRGYRVIGLPVIETYASTALGPQFAINSTELRIPLDRIAP
jgi:AraC family transcriptional regulator